MVKLAPSVRSRLANAFHALMRVRVRSAQWVITSTAATQVCVCHAARRSLIVCPAIQFTITISILGC